jgi:hypothetical protein
MKNYVLSALIFVMAVSISFGQKVKIDYDKTTDFSNYKTFTFLGWQDDSDKILNDLDRKRFRDAFKSEFEKRDLQMVEEGEDFAVSLYIVVNQKTSTTAYTNYYGGSGYRYGRGGRGWGGGYASTTYTESDYLEGTLVIDIFDAQSKELVWQGVASQTVKEKPEKREKSIPKGVTKLMKKFPIQPLK